MGRKDSALNQYKFDQIIEADEEGEDDSSQERSIMKGASRNFSQNNVALRSLSTSFPDFIAAKNSIPSSNTKLNLK
jgi:hypothetical protein